ncbi:MAG: hypothetical protein LBI31_05635 [Zoogloeaceae bacterium]|jgi:tetratricopeptide (TPR) repeat protein|nr:hypothetical protein [Zoogloeaceae bacterium]
MRNLKLSGILLALCLCVAALYAPGLGGDFVFDDFGNAVSNPALAIKSLDFASLNAAAWSGDAGPLKRPISALSFGLNQYFTGVDPYYFKLTNLVIHLINTLLVFFLARVIFSGFLKQRTAPEILVKNPDFPTHGALMAAALWGMNPLNLTSVLYVVQRMVSLSTLFGLSALLLYGIWRVSAASWGRARVAGLAFSIILLLTASAFSKESGLLFVPLLLFMELVVFRGEKDGRPLMLGKLPYQRLVRLIFWGGVIVSLLCLPMIARMDFPNREFNLVERVMTEARVLFYYLRLFFIPSLSELALFHDDFVISTGLLEPATTALSFLGLALITAATLRVYKTAPLWWFAWGWFLLSHMMESTVIGLELVHEHRNYFAMLGFVVLIPWLAYSVSFRIRRYVFAGVALFLALSAFTTWQRADLWGNPYAHAAFEAEAHPQSWRAHFKMGEQLWQAFHETKDLKFAHPALESMYRATGAYKPENNPWITILRMNSTLRKPLDPDVFATLKKRLREGAAYNNDNPSFSGFVDCQLRRVCDLMPTETVELFMAAIENPKRSNRSKSMFYAKLATYYLSGLNDARKTEESLKEAIALKGDANYHLLLVEIYIPAGRLEEAEEHLNQAIRLDRHGLWRHQIAELGKQIQEASKPEQGQKPEEKDGP